MVLPRPPEGLFTMVVFDNKFFLFPDLSREAVSGQVLQDNAQGPRTPENRPRAQHRKGGSAERPPQAAERPGQGQRPNREAQNEEPKDGGAHNGGACQGFKEPPP